MLSTANSILAIGMPGTPELLMIMFIALLLFGKRLPEVARNMGRSINEFKKGFNEVQGEFQAGMKDEASPTAAGQQPAVRPTDQPASQPLDQQITPSQPPKA